MWRADAAHMPPCSASDHRPSRAGRPCSLPARSGRTACGRLSPCGRPSWSRASRAVLLGDGGSAGRLMAIPATCRSWRCGGLDAPERCLSSGPAPALCRQRTSQRVRYGLSTRRTRLRYSYLIASQCERQRAVARLGQTILVLTYPRSVLVSCYSPHGAWWHQAQYGIFGK